MSCGLILIRQPMSGPCAAFPLTFVSLIDSLFGATAPMAMSMEEYSFGLLLSLVEVIL